MENNKLTFPPGFCFDPTDEELMLCFLYPKAANLPFYPNIIPELNLHSCEPWNIKDKALFSQNQWYFFSRLMENQATEKGYWKELDVDEPIFVSDGNKVGIKKYFKFYCSENDLGINTNWIMQEYHLSNCSLFNTSCKRRGNQKVDLNKWVLCRVHETNSHSQETDCSDNELSLLDEVFWWMDEDEEEITSSSNNM